MNQVLGGSIQQEFDLVIEGPRLLGRIRNEGIGCAEQYVLVPWDNKHHSTVSSLGHNKSCVAWEETLGQNKMDSALTHYLAAAQINPNHVNALNNAALLQIKAGHFTDAERLLRRAIVRRPDFHLAHNNLGIALVRQGRITEALPAFETAISINPSYDNAIRNRDAVMAVLENKPSP